MIILPSGALLPNNPRIGYRDIVAASTLTATGSAVDFPVSHLANPATYLTWKGDDAAGQTISITPAAAAAVDYLGIARHNLAGTLYTLQSSPDNSTWTTIATGTPTDNSPIIHVFDEAEQPYYRLVLGAGPVTPQIAVLYLGQVLTLERRLHVGHTPLPFGRARNVSSGVSESGQFLGRVLRSEMLETSVAMQNLSPEHYRTEVDPFFVAASVTPFFWASRPEKWPADVAFAWMQGDPSMVSQRNNGMVEIGFQMQGIR